MNLNHLKKFAQDARRKLMGEVSSRLEYLLGHDDAYIRANETHIGEIRRRLKQKEREQLVEEVAYTWFNRIVALRFMDLRGYTKTRIVSPQAGQVQPELLYQIKQGRTPKALQSLEETFDAYLTGRIRTDQPDREIYTAALLGMCNAYTETLPFLFRRVDEYMAVLLPTDLLSENSILADVQKAITEDDVEDVEVIGWLYQFYISEKKDQVFARPKGEKIKKEDIPAATQLFTPHWIVRYMVENSLGRLWRNNFPDTRVSEQMDYYIEGDPEPDYLKISGPEEITLLDPACGSGHILTYAFDLLYAMYEEAGYTPSEIPSLILQNNLYGIDIDPRAAELAAFALTMKAREKDRFFFQRGVEPNVIAMEDVDVDLRSAHVTMSPQLMTAFGYLREATNFGSLIPVPEEVQPDIEQSLVALSPDGDFDLFANETIAAARAGLQQLSYLSSRYHCVVTNPPYMASKSANGALKSFIENHYVVGKADLYSAFIRRCSEFLRDRGFLAMITQQGWMLQPRSQPLREWLLKHLQLVGLVHLGSAAFETVSGEVVQTAAFAARQFAPAEAQNHARNTTFVRLVSYSAKDKQVLFKDPSTRFVRAQTSFQGLPGKEIAYWLSPRLIRSFKDHPPIVEFAECLSGLQTGNNDRFLRLWFEVSWTSIQFGLTREDRPTSVDAWVPHTKGGSARKWYGNLDYVLDWHRGGRRLRDYEGTSLIKNSHRYFNRCVTWSHTSSGMFGVRYVPAGFIFNVEAPSAFCREGNDSCSYPAALGSCLARLQCYLNSSVVDVLLRSLNNELHFLAASVGKLPFPPAEERVITRLLDISKTCTAISREEWNSREVSWGFDHSPLLSDYSSTPTVHVIDEQLIDISWHSAVDRVESIAQAYPSYVAHWTEQFKELCRLEEENNRIFIDLYGLQDELSPEVPYSEVTILQDELDKDARERGEIVFNKKEVLRQFVSYGVGCIFGRYSLDKDGLILANAGDSLDTYLERIPEPRLRPDESGILPITEDDDFPDDLPSQFRAFLRAAFGTEHYDENVQFLEEGLGRDLRSYFLKDFYKDHVKRYKKRPIYWLITSPKGSLRALIYLHRYNRDTVNRFLNDYLRPYQRKLEARRRTAEQSLNSGGLSGSERTKARKDIDRISAALEELSVWERDVVRPLAEQRVELDLDDGVKVNYGKLGAILETVKGLNG